MTDHVSDPADQRPDPVSDPGAGGIPTEPRDELAEEYDFSGAERGVYYARAKNGVRVFYVSDAEDADTSGGWVAVASFDVTADSYAAIGRDYGEPI